jgi:glycosyltransferase involved in cell wall biosynthesis
MQKFSARKSVCHISSAHSGHDPRIYLKECLSLAKSGWETHLVISATREEVYLAEQANVKIHSLCRIRNRVLRILFKPLLAYLKAFDTNAEILHIHDPELVPIGFIAAVFGKKIIYDVHEDVVEDIRLKRWIPKMLRSLIAYSVGMVQAVGCRSFSAIVAATPHIKKKFIRQCKHVVCVHNFPCESTIDESVADFSKRGSTCYIGALSRDRGLLEIVMALAKVDQKVSLEILGDCHEKKLLKEVAVMPNWQRVKYGGFQDQEGVAKVLKRCFVGLAILHPTPTFIDALPTKVFEYMAAGIPVIASNFQILHDIINPAKCGICVDPMNPDEIGNAIQYLYSNPEVGKEMGMNGKNAIKTFYNWSLEEKKLLNLYNKIIAF